MAYHINWGWIGGEAQLDVQYAGGISYPVQNVYYTTAGRPPFNASIGTPDNNSEPYLEFLQYLLAQKNPPQTISTSYGDEEQTVPIEYAKRVCGLFAQLGARGVTFLFSSGDGGVGDGRVSKLVFNFMRTLSLIH
jgi:tripeptidyl-peptidase-1